MLIENNLRAKS